MRKLRLIGTTLALFMGVALFAPHSADAARKKKPEAAAAEPVAIEQPIPLEPAGLDFGKTAKEVTAIYSKAIDKDYGKAYTEVEPGTEQRRLDEEVQREKDAFKKSILVLDAPPSNMDGTRFVGEFTYGNAEAVMRSVRQGKERTLFFIGDKLWKVIDIYELAEKSKMGADFKSAVAHIEKMTGVPGRSRAANPEQGRRFDEVDWANAKIHLRLIHWDEKKVAVAFVERATAARLSELRAHKEKPPVDMDPAVKGVLR